MRLLRYIILFVIIVVLALNARSQIVGVDSVQQELDNSFGDSKLPILIKLSRKHLSTSSAQVRKYSLQALSLAEHYEDTSYIALAYSYIGASYMMDYSYDTAFNLLNKGLLLAEQVNNPKVKVRLYNNLATLYELENDNKMAFKNYKLAVETIEKYNVTDAYLPRLSLAAFYCKLKKPAKAEELYKKIIFDAIENHDENFQILALLNYIESQCIHERISLSDQYQVLDSIQQLARKHKLTKFDNRISKQYISYLYNSADYPSTIDSAIILLKVKDLDGEIQKTLYQTISLSYEKLHDYLNALKYRKKLDSINSVRFTSVLKKMTKNQNAVYMLSNQEIIYNQIQLERTRERNEAEHTKVYINVGIAIIILLIIIIFYLVYMLENKDGKEKNDKKDKISIAHVMSHQKDVFGDFDHLNIPAFRLSSSFMYLSSNDLFLELAEKKNQVALTGCNDFDLKWKQFAEQLVEEYEVVRDTMRVRMIDGKYMEFSKGITIMAIPLEERGVFDGIQALIISDDLLPLQSIGTKKNIIMKDKVTETKISTPSKNISVLAVDDQIDNLFLIKTYLKKANVQLVTAGSGREAIELAKERKFDFILMDIKMPDMDGVETARQIKNKNLSSGSKIYALTASTNDDADIRSKELFSDVVHKPISKKELYSKLSISLEP